MDWTSSARPRRRDGEGNDLLSKPPIYRAAILGCGERGRAHVTGLLADSRVQIVALADVKRESADKCRADFKLPVEVYADAEELLAKEKPDIVVIALWTGLHLPVIRACTEAGVRLVMCEKPIAATWSECLEIGRLAKDSGVALTFCHQRRFASGNLAVRKELEAGRFGKIERMDMFAPAHLLDCGTHSVDQALSFNGETPAKWVLGAVDLSKTVKYFGIIAEGAAAGTVFFENGVHATIRTDLVDMDMWGGVRVTGDAGFVEVFWDGEIRRAVVYKDPSWKFPKVKEKPNEQMIGVVRNGIDAMKSGGEAELSHRKAMRATEILFALYESSRRRERIALPLEGVTGSPLLQMLEER